MPAQTDLYYLPGFEDPISSMSHLLGAVVFACLSVPLLRRGRGDPVRVASLGVYAFSCVFLLLMSACYHMLPHGTGGRAVMERLDHSAIFILIAGTFTPTHCILFRGPWRWGPLLAVWGAVVIGITLKTIFFPIPEWLSLSLYLALGWVGGVSLVALWRRFGPRFVAPLLWGALAYTVGAVMEFFQWFTIIPRVLKAHELFHLLVLVGAAFHWRFVWQFADGTVPRRRNRAAALGGTPETAGASVLATDRPRDQMASG